MFLEELKRTCFACPSQWEGKLADGLRIYVSYRCGTLRLGYGRTIDKAIQNNFTVWTSKDRLAGAMTTQSMLKIIGLHRA